MTTRITLTSEITVRLVQQMGGDHMVAAAARVSTSGEDALVWADPAKADEVGGLIRYLMKHRHGTPFEHGALTFFVHAPIFVWREWHRHRIGFSYNEESGRYKVLEPVFWIPRLNRPMLIPEGGHKPARPRFEPIGDGDLGLYEVLREHSRVVCQDAYDAYLWEIEAGIAPEVARRLLPVSIYSSCWVTCNPRSLMHFLSLRIHEPEASAFISYPQAEIEEAAAIAENILHLGWPLTHEAFVECGRVGP